LAKKKADPGAAKRQRYLLQLRLLDTHTSRGAGVDVYPDDLAVRAMELEIFTQRHCAPAIAALRDKLFGEE